MQRPHHFFLFLDRMMGTIKHGSYSKEEAVFQGLIFSLILTFLPTILENSWLKKQV